MPPPAAPASRALAAPCALLLALGACARAPEPAAPAGADPCARLPFLDRYAALGAVTRWPGAVQLRLRVDQRSADGPSPCAGTDLRVVLELAAERPRCRVARARVWSFEDVGCEGPAAPPGLRRIEAFRVAGPVDLADPALARVDLEQRRRVLVLLPERFWWFDPLEPGQEPLLRLRRRDDPPTACCLGATSSAFGP